MSDDPGAPAIGSGNEGDVVRESLTTIYEPLELSRRTVTEVRAVTAGENGGEPPPFLSDGAMTDCVDAAVNRDQATGSQPALDLIAAQSEPEELPERNDPVLAAGDLGHHHRYWAELSAHTAPNPAQWVGAPGNGGPTDGLFGATPAPAPDPGRSPRGGCGPAVDRRARAMRR